MSNPTNVINKVIFGGDTLIDLSNDTVTQSDVLSGKYVHLPNGARVQGNCTYDADTSDGDALASEILYGKFAYVNATKLTGAMPNRGAVSGEITTVNGQYTVQNGYHDGSGKVQINASEQAKIVPTNIKSGVQILGVTGNYSGAGVNAQAKSVTPSVNAQTVLPDTPTYDYLSQVTVNAIPYTETANTKGYTAVIG